MQNWETMQQATYNHNWFGNMFSKKTESPHSPILGNDHHQHPYNNTNHKSHTLDMNSPTYFRTEGIDGHGYYDNQMYNSQSNTIHNSIGFNPLTPPGYPNPIIPQINFTQEKPQEESLSNLSRENVMKIETSESLTPSHTPPLDITSTSKFQNETPENTDISSSCNDSGEETRFSETDDAIRTPKYNSHGKVKQHRCKQCNFVAITKVSFWEHAKMHIKPDKMLECPRCPFVTELKHHLEYHIRKHNNIKPFQCNQCSYTCVNKSMLNSHLKSHSEICQFNCLDCEYATKYCHSFKMHLRKYTHKPGLILNEDGSPNPDIIIDVYGTRRGPKMKSITNRQSQKRENSIKNSSSKDEIKSSSQQKFGGQQQKIIPPPKISPIPTQNQHPPQPNMMSNLALTNMNMALLPYLSQLNLHVLAAQQQAMLARLPQNVRDATIKSINGSINGDQDDDTESEYDSIIDDRSERSESGAMDLSQGTPTKITQSDSIQQLDRDYGTPSMSGVKANRRKGRAFKLALTIQSELTKETSQQQCYDDSTKPLDMDYDETSQSESLSNENDQMLSQLDKSKTDGISTTTKTTTITNSTTPVNPLETIKPIVSSSDTRTVPPDAYECKYCDIFFKDTVLYQIHMGYHSCDDIFKCNMCGEQCKDAVGFFVHVARFPHS